jgi:hypothetical protein
MNALPSTPGRLQTWSCWALAARASIASLLHLQGFSGHGVALSGLAGKLVAKRSPHSANDSISLLVSDICAFRARVPFATRQLD